MDFLNEVLQDLITEADEADISLGRAVATHGKLFLNFVQSNLANVCLAQHLVKSEMLLIKLKEAHRIYVAKLCGKFHYDCKILARLERRYHRIQKCRQRKRIKHCTIHGSSAELVMPSTERF